MTPFGGPAPGEHDRYYDELLCLNLTVTAPIAALAGFNTAKIPILVYVHGGAFAQGAHYGAVHGTEDATLSTIQ